MFSRIVVFLNSSENYIMIVSISARGEALWLGVDISERVDLTYICSNYTRNNNLEPSATPGVDDRGLFVFVATTFGQRLVQPYCSQN